PRGLRYYAIAPEVSDADRAALRTVASLDLYSCGSRPDGGSNPLARPLPFGPATYGIREGQRAPGARPRKPKIRPSETVTSCTQLLCHFASSRALERPKGRAPIAVSKPVLGSIR